MTQDKETNSVPEPENDGKFFDDMATEEPERDVDIDLPKGGGGGVGAVSLEDAENSPNTTDLQATLARLFPTFKHKIIDKVAQSVMVARISPDVFLDMIYLTVTSVVEEMDADGEEDIDVQTIINMVYAAFSIGLEGKGRVDAISLAGAQQEKMELDAVSRSLGLN